MLQSLLLLTPPFCRCRLARTFSILFENCRIWEFYRPHSAPKSTTPTCHPSSPDSPKYSTTASSADFTLHSCCLWYSCRRGFSFGRVLSCLCLRLNGIFLYEVVAWVIHSPSTTSRYYPYSASTAFPTRQESRPAPPATTPTTRKNTALRYRFSLHLTERNRFVKHRCFYRLWSQFRVS